MIEVQLPQKPYNVDLLDQELKTALTIACLGVTGRKGIHWAILADDAPAGSDVTARSIATAHNAAALTPEQTLRETVKTTAQSAVGVAYDALTAGQVRALFAILLWREGALNNDGTVKPLGEWVR